MKKEDNFTHESLLQRIELLKVLKVQQESTISLQYSELIDCLNPETLLKDTIKHLATDKDTQKNLATVAVKAGTNFLIEKFLGSNNSIKGYISSLLAEKVSNSFIGSMISKL